MGTGFAPRVRIGIRRLRPGLVLAISIHAQEGIAAAHFVIAVRLSRPGQGPHNLRVRATGADGGAVRWAGAS
ncbi:hypothetical protein [Actinacidiphila oryziradicis]|uniref:hypothetical protein n=1 Tax=Actinacidiphila oryziradicis TaxID=2571141 RepID=UPI00145D2BFC|nr:hypothetical protein [Actinacidiphila oryziradicis]